MAATREEAHRAYAAFVETYAPFELARHVFTDAAHYTGQGYDENGELRYHTLGRVSEHLVLRVTHTDRTRAEVSRIRILSARKADAKERKTYERKAFP